jgi:hypothetical protein
MATTTNYGWDTPDDTDLVKDGAAAIRTLGSSVDTTVKNLNPETTLGDIAYRSATANTNTRLPIGSNGQILGVSAGVPAWINNDQGDITEVQAGTGISVASGTGPIPVVTNTVATAFDAKGDLIGGTGADTFAKLTVGANDTVLTADSSTATGLKWAAPAAGGKVLQVVTTHKTDTFSTATSGSFVDITGLSASITPIATNSKILIMASVGIAVSNDALIALNLVRTSTSIGMADTAGSRVSAIAGRYLGTGAAAGNTLAPESFVFVDSPSTTSSTTYKIQILQNSGGTVYVNRSSGDGDSANIFRQASNITLMEIGA